MMKLVTKIRTVMMNATVSTVTLATLAVTAPGALAASPTAYFQYGGIVGENSQIYLSRIPVANSLGQITYYDGTISFTVSTDGKLSTPPTVTFIASPTLATAHFVPGRYYAPSNYNSGYALGTVSSGVGAGGSTVWTWTVDTSAPSSWAPRQAAWQTGSPAPDIAARMISAKIPNNSSYSYGTASVSGGYFCSNSLLAAQQVGSTISLISYSYCGDSSTQVGSVVLKQCVDSNCSNAGR